MQLLATLLFMPLFYGPAAAQASKPGLSPCALVTKAEVQEAANAPVSEGVVNASNKAVCDFRAGDTGSVIGVTLVSRSTVENAEKMVGELKKRKINAEVLAGFGDSAYTSSPGYGMQQCGVYKGSSHVIVTVLIPAAPEARSKAIAQAVMRKALARIP